MENNNIPRRLIDGFRQSPTLKILLTTDALLIVAAIAHFAVRILAWPKFSQDDPLIFGAGVCLINFFVFVAIVVRNIFSGKTWQPLLSSLLVLSGLFCAGLAGYGWVVTYGEKWRAYHSNQAMKEMASRIDSSVARYIRDIKDLVTFNHEGAGRPLRYPLVILKFVVAEGGYGFAELRWRKETGEDHIAEEREQMADTSWLQRPCTLVFIKELERKELGDYHGYKVDENKRKIMGSDMGQVGHAVAVRLGACAILWPEREAVASQSFWGCPPREISVLGRVGEKTRREGDALVIGWNRDTIRDGFNDAQNQLSAWLLSVTK
jgi:hypothetical protein